MSCETSCGIVMLAALFMTGIRHERLITSPHERVIERALNN
jgi:hypothetical protein